MDLPSQIPEHDSENQVGDVHQYAVSVKRPFREQVDAKGKYENNRDHGRQPEKNGLTFESPLPVPNLFGGITRTLCQPPDLISDNPLRKRRLRSDWWRPARIFLGRIRLSCRLLSGTIAVFDLSIMEITRSRLVTRRPRTIFAFPTGSCTARR